ncbi:MAG TPA: class I adenylate-forming enzyme family protein, partial [Alphaproteobacteria bacterium]|nr:class I adenylate-forming enzyme family protein [Alphaproteobacteria bacterium]
MTMPATGPRHPLVHPFSAFDVPALLAARAETRPEHPFIVWEPFDGEPRIWTYRQFREEVRRIGAGLLARGAAPGEHVLIHMDNCPEILLAWYACAEIGAVAVTTNARSSGDEIAYFAEHCGAVAGITQPAFAERVGGSAKGLRWLAVTDSDSDGSR